MGEMIRLDFGGTNKVVERIEDETLHEDITNISESVAGQINPLSVMNLSGDLAEDLVNSGKYVRNNSKISDYLLDFSERGMTLFQAIGIAESNRDKWMTNPNYFFAIKDFIDTKLNLSQITSYVTDFEDERITLTEALEKIEAIQENWLDNPPYFYALKTFIESKQGIV